MRATFYSVQSVPTGKVSIMARPRGGDWLRDEVKALREAGSTFWYLYSLLMKSGNWILEKKLSVVMTRESSTFLSRSQIEVFRLFPR